MESSLVPFILKYKSGLTRKLLIWIIDATDNGMSLRAVATMLKTQYIFEYESRKKDFIRYQRNSGNNKESSLKNITFPTMCELIRFPSREFIIASYISSAKQYVSLFDMERNQLEVDYLAIDHTFKISTKIGHLDKSSKRFVKQYNSLFFAMNGKGQVLEFKLTKSTKLDEVGDLLRRINSRMQHPLQLIMVDNCCQSALILKRFFGNQLQVKLDLFHATQRLSGVIPKKTALRNQILKEYALVFRDTNDIGRVRSKATPTSNVLQSNLELFKKKWMVHISGQVIENRFKRIVKVLSDIENHIHKGCLSGIPCSAGTNRNEIFHRYLRQHGILKQVKLGVELGEAGLMYAVHKRNFKAGRNMTDDHWLDALIHAKDAVEGNLSSYATHTQQEESQTNGR